MIATSVFVLHFFALIAVSWSQPTNCAKLRDRSYYRPHGGYSVDRLQQGMGERRQQPEAAPFPHSMVSHAQSDFSFQRRDMRPLSESHLPRDQGKTSFQPRGNRQQETPNPEHLSSRTVDNNESHHGPQSLGGHGKRPQSASCSKGSSCGHRPNQGLVMSNSFSRNSTESHVIVFPEEERNFLPRDIDCGEGKTFCEGMGADYPEDYIREILRKESHRFKGIFGNSTSPEMNVVQRIFKGEDYLCQSIKRLIFPTKAKTKDDKWQFIINQEGYKQGIEVEICQNEEKPCSMTDAFPIAYATACKQKYVTQKMLSLNGMGGPGLSEFLFPSCCVCTLYPVSYRAKTSG